MNIFKQITANNIIIKEYKFIKELAMEAYLIENEGILKLDDINFGDVNVLDAEIALKQGRAGKDGRIDILAKYGSEYLAIVELKLNEINEDSLTQLKDYLNKKEQILEMNNEYWDNENETPKWIGVLVGTSINSELQNKLIQGYKYNDIPIAGITLKRYRTESNEIFVISDTYFKFNYSNKDYSKFMFNGKEYNKSRLVENVIKYYVETHPEITFSELKKVFPDHLQGTLGVFDSVENATAIYNNSGYKRHYINPEELITLKDVTISVTTQWGRGNIDYFINCAKNLKLKIELK